MPKRRSIDSIELGRTFLEVPDSPEGLDPEEMIFLARALPE